MIQRCSRAKVITSDLNAHWNSILTGVELSVNDSSRCVRLVRLIVCSSNVVADRSLVGTLECQDTNIIDRGSRTHTDRLP